MKLAPSVLANDARPETGAGRWRAGQPVTLSDPTASPLSGTLGGWRSVARLAGPRPRPRQPTRNRASRRKPPGTGPARRKYRGRPARPQCAPGRSRTDCRRVERISWDLNGEVGSDDAVLHKGRDFVKHDEKKKRPGLWARGASESCYAPRGRPGSGSVGCAPPWLSPSSRPRSPAGAGRGTEVPRQ